ncbi:MAG: signal peptide prediction [Rubrivivax sp.]|nr:signal peptide prediction [Rubrivivax sp.]
MAPCTAVGVLPALLLCAVGASARRVTGVLEVAFDSDRLAGARLLARLPFSAITLGHIVLARTHACHRAVRSHERVHVAQYERWGLLFFVLYLGSSAWQLLRGRRPYVDNHLERQARRLAGDDDPPVG